MHPGSVQISPEGSSPPLCSASAAPSTFSCVSFLTRGGRGGEEGPRVRMWVRQTTTHGYMRKLLRKPGSARHLHAARSLTDRTSVPVCSAHAREPKESNTHHTKPPTPTNIRMWASSKPYAVRTVFQNLRRHTPCAGVVPEATTHGPKSNGQTVRPLLALAPHPPVAPVGQLQGVVL